MATAKAGIGSILKMGAATSPFAPVTIPLVSELTGPELDANEYDVTSQDSTSGYSEYILGLLQSGTVQATVFFDANDTVHVSLLTVHTTKALRYFEIAIAGSSPVKKWTFMAYVKTLNYAYPVDGIQTADMTLRITGPVTLV